MSEHENAKAINDAAADWVARIDGAPGDPTVEARLAEWLAGDDRRRGAYFRARSAWHMLDRANALKTHPSPAEPEETHRQSPKLDRRRLVVGGGVVATFAMLTAGIAILRDPFGEKAPTVLETGIGEIRRVPLADGSLAEINTDSRVAVKLRPEVRGVTLDRGEAFFQVAHDTARPFLVSAGDIRVQAVGTAFSVRRTETGAEVRVTEGKVMTWSVNGTSDHRLVEAGSRAVMDAVGKRSEVAKVGEQIDRDLAWRNGQLIFDGDTLFDAVAEFNRYNKVQIHVDDPALGNERLVGRFRTNELDAFVKATATMLGARVETSQGVLRLSRK